MIRREAVQAGLLPGEVLDKTRIELFKRRLMMLGYFTHDPEKRDKQIRVEIKRRRPADQPYGDLMIPSVGEVTQARMQEPGPGGEGGGAPLTVPSLRALPPPGSGGDLPGLQPFRENPFSPPADRPPHSSFRTAVDGNGGVTTALPWKTFFVKSS